ncbi:MAG: hypothetical protein JXB32_06315 [Deltaproteobacteria bacterium]|nr:hypothetical protein [Deltaproteobacteria bacterium]
MSRHLLWFAGACGAVLGGACVEATTVATEDVHDNGADADVDAEGDDAAEEVPDAEAEDEFSFLDGDVPSDAPPAVWTDDDCVVVGDTMRIFALGRTGDPCAMTGICGSMPTMPGTPAHLAYCDVTGHLVVVNTLCEWCTGPAAEPWTDCAAALAGGATGQACTGEWTCIEEDPSDRCCIRAAECGAMDSPYWPTGVLSVTHACLSSCPTEAFADRPTRDACPGTRTPTSPEPLLGDTCTGDWTCAAPRDAFAAPPAGFGGGCDEAPIPMWCADGVTLLAPNYGCRNPMSTCE